MAGIISLKYIIPMKCNPLLVNCVPVRMCEGSVMPYIGFCVRDACYVCVCACMAICLLLSPYISLSTWDTYRICLGGSSPLGMLNKHSGLLLSMSCVFST